MEDDGLNDSGPDISIASTISKDKNKKRISLFSIILIILVLAIIIFIACKLIIKKNDLDLSREVFTLSDNSTLLFLDDENYILTYKVMDRDIKMKGKYRFTYGNNLNENLKFEYKTYIEEFKKEDYILAFLELQNEELYVNDIKSENGYVNTYYILMVYYEDGEIKFSGYNIDTGIKVNFEKQSGKFDEYLNKLEVTE
jgi:hypothetical protein